MKKSTFAEILNISANMKKLSYVLTGIAMCGLVASCGHKAGYVISGNVEGASNGEIVYLQEPQGRTLVNLDSTVITNGKFEFRGTQDSTINAVITWEAKEGPQRAGLYLENGDIKVKFTEDNNTVTGTALNNASQEMKDKIVILNNEREKIQNTLKDSSLSETEAESKTKELEDLNKKEISIYYATIEKNIDNDLGYNLFRNIYYVLTLDEKENILSKFPAKYDNDPSIERIRAQVDSEKNTAVGKVYTNLTMNNPEGKEVSLSDYVGKGKLVLIDFWASWCGPCRREMPELVKLYNKFKTKNFEIVGVSLDNNSDAWKNAIKQMNMTWPQMSDLKGWQCEGASVYGVSSIPYTILVSADGTILERNLQGDALYQKIEELLN